MSLQSKLPALAALAFCALAFAQGPTQGTGGGFPPAPPAALINQTAAVGNTMIATCPAATAHFCLYLAAMTLACNPANPGTGTGSLTGFIAWTDEDNIAYNITGAGLNVATCSAQFTTSYQSFLDHPLMVGPGKTVQVSVGLGTMTGTYNYDVAWFLLPIGQL